MRAILAALWVGSLMYGVQDAGAQVSPAVIKGILKDAGRRPINGARVTLLGRELGATTSDRGEFEFDGLQPGRYVIRAAAIGFEMLTFPVDIQAGQIIDLELEIARAAVRLPDVAVTKTVEHGPADWIRRRAEGRGRYVTREDIEKRQAATLPDVISSLPGVIVECNDQTEMRRRRGGGEPIVRGPSCRVRMARAVTRCEPAFFMDGVRAQPAVAYMTPVRDVEGIEVYYGPSQTPPELESGRGGCGVIAIWTRPPPPPKNGRRVSSAKIDTVATPPPDTTSIANVWVLAGRSR